MKKLLFLLSFILITTPLYAVEFSNGDFKANIYGEIYADGFYNYGNDGSLSTHTFESLAFTGTSNLGVELSYGNISGTFEAGLADPVRRFFLTYNFAGKEDHYLLIGKDAIIAAYTVGQVSNDIGGLSDFGAITDATRRYQLRYGIKGFEMAIIIPSLGGSWSPDFSDDTGYKMGTSTYEPFMVIPRVELAYTYSNDTLEFKVFGAYGAYLYEDTNNAAKDKVFHSYHVGVGGQANFGNSFLQYTAWYGNNIDMTDGLTTYKSRYVGVDSTGNISMFLEDGTKSENIQSAGVAIGIGHTFNDKFTPQAGVGYTLNFGDGYDKIDDRIGAYLNCVIQINDWFSVIPEIAYMDYMQDSFGSREGYDIIAGAVALLSF